ncbi:MAG: hypothetical protein HY303_15765 [Candidatus Wallbacteria bacterium]|nr:hypothetical protein [Candidatus Wallbacteria bacterium]
MKWVQTLQKLAVAALAFLFAGGCAGTTPPAVYKPQVGSYESGRKIYFSMRDPRGDDKGPGTYIYPLRFDNREGFFDIEKFQVEDAGAMIDFRITTRRPIQKFRPDGSSEAKGWFLQLMDIYIDKDHKPGSGVTRTLPGRFVEFADDSAWEQMILVTPNRSVDVKRLIESRTNDMELVHLKPKIVIPETVFVEGFDFVVQVPKALIGEPQPTWGYQCLMMQFDDRALGNHEFQNAKIYKFPTDTNFGGGSDFFGNPAVLDLLAPTEELQTSWLNAYNPSSNPDDSQLATIHCVYADVQAKPPITTTSRRTRASTAFGSPALRSRSAARPRPASRRAAAAPRPASVATDYDIPESAVVAAEDPTPQETYVTRKSSAKVRVAGSRPPARTRSDEAQDDTPPPSKRYKPVAAESGARYRTESFSGDPDDLFVNVPRSR